MVVFFVEGSLGRRLSISTARRVPWKEVHPKAKRPTIHDEDRWRGIGGTGLCVGATGKPTRQFDENVTSGIPTGTIDSTA